MPTNRRGWGAAWRPALRIVSAVERVRGHAMGRRGVSSDYSEWAQTSKRVLEVPASGPLGRAHRGFGASTAASAPNPCARVYETSRLSLGHHPVSHRPRARTAEPKHRKLEGRIECHRLRQAPYRGYSRDSTSGSDAANELRISRFSRCGQSGDASMVSLASFRFKSLIWKSVN